MLVFITLDIYFLDLVIFNCRFCQKYSFFIPRRVVFIFGILFKIHSTISMRRKTENTKPKKVLFETSLLCITSNHGTHKHNPKRINYTESRHPLTNNLLHFSSACFPLFFYGIVTFDRQFYFIELFNWTIFSNRTFPQILILGFFNFFFRD